MKSNILSSEFAGDKVINGVHRVASRMHFKCNLENINKYNSIFQKKNKHKQPKPETKLFMWPFPSEQQKGSRDNISRTVQRGGELIRQKFTSNKVIQAVKLSEFKWCQDSKW